MKENNYLRIPQLTNFNGTENLTKLSPKIMIIKCQC